MKRHTKSALICIICVICVLSFSSCSPQKRLERLLRKYPELTISDTINYTTLVPIPAKTAEFTINYTYRDTLINLFSNDSLKLSYTVINDSLIKVLVYVPPDTIFISRNIPVDKIKVIKPDYWNQTIDKIPYIALAIIALIFGALYFSKK